MIRTRVHAILLKISGEPNITDETSLNDLRLDSLDKIQVALDLEEAFFLEIPDDDIDDPRLGTAAGIVAYVEGRVAALQGPLDDYWAAQNREQERAAAMRVDEARKGRVL